MKTDVFEKELRQALARRAARVPGEAVQRLERRDYWPRSRSRRAMAAAGLVSAAAAGAAAGPRRRTMLAASAAAAVILLGGAGYGLAAAFAGHAASPAGSTKTAALTAVNGCARLAQVTGTLEQVNGTALVIQASNGQSVTVTTTAATRVSLSAAPLSDITDGADVRVDGVKSDGTIAAGKVAVGELPSGKSQPPGGKHTVQTLPGATIAQGTVADATSAGFTVDTSAGTRVPVTTSGSTLVVVNSASPSELQTGAKTIVVGYAEPDGRLPAIAIAQFPSAARGTLVVSGCSPSSIDNAITTAFLAGS
jgi:hypothetical protein